MADKEKTDLDVLKEIMFESFPKFKNFVEALEALAKDIDPVKLEPKVSVQEIMKEAGKASVAQFKQMNAEELAPDEWHAIFPDYRDLSSGMIQRRPWGGGSNMTATFKVYDHRRIAKLETENQKLRTEIEMRENRASVKAGLRKQYNARRVAELEIAINKYACDTVQKGFFDHHSDTCRKCACLVALRGKDVGV